MNYRTSTEHDIQEFFRDKRVILVGPAEYMVGMKRGEWIDSFDIVVRCNRSRPIPQDYGSRTDVLYHFMTELWGDYFIGEDNFKKDGTKIAFTTKSLPVWYERFLKALPEEIAPIHLTEEEYNLVRVGSKPNTGTLAIAHLLTLPIASLRVVGIDLYATGYYDGYGGDLNPGTHDFDLQAIFLKELIDNEPRLRVDKQLLDRCKAACTYIEEPIVKPLPEVSLLIPFKSDNGGYWDSLLDFAVERYKRLFPEFEICIGIDNSEPFNRAKAKNEAARKATKDWFCIVDLDALFNRSLLHEAFSIIRGGWVRMGGRSVRIDEKSREKLLSGQKEVIFNTEGFYATNFFSLMRKDFFFAIDGFDEVFNGWGGEDYAFFKSMEVYFGKPKRTKGRVWHIWHPTSPGSEEHMKSLKEKDGQVETANRHLRYARAKTKMDIRKIKRELGKDVFNRSYKRKR